MAEPASVSVIIPCYRCLDTIERAVASVAAQTQKPAEVILVDDHSSDGTLEILDEIKSRYPKGWIKVIASSTNGGPGTARNLGWSASTQAYIAFLDADDSWHPQKIEIQYGWMIRHPEVSLTGHPCQQVENGDFEGCQVQFSTSGSGFYKIKKNQLLLSNRFPTRSVMLRRDIGHRFANGKRYSEDYQLWLEICCGGLICCRAELPLAYSYKAAYGDAGLSAALWKMEKGEINTYKVLARRHFISPFSFLFLCSLSLLKFSIRFVKVSLSRFGG